jgi:polysaccharide deacetylase family protein (PEP-CTERM system associated)
MMAAHASAPIPDAEQFPAVGKRWSAPVAELSNALTCDVEDYFQVSAFEHLVQRSTWGEWECRVLRNVELALELYAEAGVHGTFFTLGWVAENHPDVVRRIAAAGHEIASHGMQHVRVWSQRTRKVLEDVSGCPVRGYRAASWSLDQRTPWAHRVMAEAGYQYSSSIYPVSHDHYGIPDAPLTPFYIADADILEIPASAARAGGRNVPAAGGGYFRLLPYVVSRSLVRLVRRQNGVPAVFYFHPWELDPDQPRMPNISVKTRFRHYVNLGRFEGRLRQLLRDFRWDRMDRIFLGDAG